MKARALTFVAASLLALASCTTNPLRALVACKGACDVTVPVVKNGNTCTIGPLSVEHIDIAPDPQPTVIKWTISGDASFRFDRPNGVAFDKPTGAPPSNVMQNGSGGGRVVTVTDKHTGPETKGRWYYSIYVTDGTVRCALDPSVDNN